MSHPRPMLVVAALILALVAAAPLAARAQEGGEVSHPGPAAGEELRKGAELFAKGDYAKARVELEKALAKSPEDDDARRLLAWIAYYYAEDAVAREHIGKLFSKGPDEQKLLAIMESPFAPIYKDAVVTMQGISDKGYYHISTDLGFDQKKWDAIKADHAKLAEAAKKNKKAQKALEQFLRRNRTVGLAECSAAMDLIYEQYLGIFPASEFKKDPKLIARVIFFRERGDYIDFTNFITGDTKADETAGMYIHHFRLLVVSRSDAGKKYGETMWQGTRETAFHEAFHQFIAYWAPGCPSWMNEGLAEFFSTTDEDPKTKQVVPGLLKRLPIGSEGMTNYQQMVGAFKPTAIHKPWPIKEFIRFDQSKFYAEDISNKLERGARRAANYSQGWGLCYFLIHGYGKDGRKIIVDYIKALRDGKSPDEAADIAFKKFQTDEDWEKLEKKWRQFFAALEAEGERK